MKKSKIIAIGVACIVIVFGVAILVTSLLEDVLAGQQERNYNRFVSNVEGLTNTYRQPIEQCAQAEPSLQDRCVSGVISEFQIQFGTLIKLFGYESHIEDLYRYWKADLDFWYKLKQLEIQYSDDPELLSSEIEKITKARQELVNARLNPEFATSVESGS